LPFLKVLDLLVIGHVQLLLVAMGAHALDVAAGAERGAGAGDQQHADVGVLAAELDHVAQRRRQIVGQGIADRRAVERDDRDAVADYAQEFVGAGVDFSGRHVELPYVPSAPSLRGANGSRECAPDDRLRDEAIQLFFVQHGLLRCARNDGNV